MSRPPSAGFRRSRERGGILLKLIKWIVIVVVLAAL